MTHDLYVVDGQYAHAAARPRVLVRCVRCGRLGIGMIEAAGDRLTASRHDSEHDAGHWWNFDNLRLLGMPGDCPGSHWSHRQEKHPCQSKR